MSGVGWATISVIPSMKDFGPKLSSGINPLMVRAGKDGGKHFGSGLSSTASSIGGKAGKLLGVGVVSTFALAVAGIGAVLKTGFGEAMDASKGTAQLAAGIKSTGGAAGVSVKSLNALASSIQGYSGQTDDSIVASEKLLLTFTNIKNKGPNKIFDLATTATADMAAKMGGDASGAAIQLGKALNDPVKGISALSRVGVSFTQAQKDSIAAMVKHGDVAGAQKIILGELTAEFGGAAKAAGTSLPGQMAIAKRSFEDLSQSVVTGLMPAFSAGLSGINNFVQGVQKSFSEGGLSQVFTDIGAKITAAWPGIQAQLATWGTALWAWIQAAVPPMLVKLGELLVAFETWVWTVAYPAIAAKLVAWGKAFVEWIAPMIPPALVALGGLLTSLGNWIWSVGFPALQGKLAQWGKAFWAWVVPAIGPLLVALGGMLLRLVGWVVTVALPAILSQLGQWAWAFIKWVGPMIPPMLLELGKLLLSLGVWILTTALPAIVSKIGEWALAFLKWVADVIVSLPLKLAGLLGVIVTWAASVPGKITTALGNLLTLLTQKGKDVIQGFWDGMLFVWNKVTSWVSGIATWIKDHKGPIGLDAKLLTPHGNAIMQGFWDGLKSGFSQVQSGVSGMAGQISSGVSQWLPIVTQALAMLGQPLSLAPIVLSRMNQESGGNANAINNWDSNAAMGDPSRGLMQTIGSTFNAYRLPGLSGNIYDPLANIVASMRYALSRYGSLSSAYNRPGGYALGTSNAAPGYAWVGERGPELMKFRGGEQVVPNHRLGAGSGGGNGATSDDIRALGNRIGAELDRQARTIQTMQRQMA